MASEYYHLEKSFEQHGFHQSEYVAPLSHSDTAIPGNTLEADINLISDEILKAVISCEITGKLFRIIPQELAFYRRYGLSLPTKHPDQRHRERMQLR